MCFRDFMLSFTFPLWTLTVCLSEGVQTSSEGRPQVVGSRQPIVATLGDDVILPCHVEPLLNVENMMVEWWKRDPGDPESEYKYVHRYHDNRDVEDLKLSAYVGRTTLFTDGLKHGNISLKITNLKLSDRGRYRCLILQLWSSAVIKLNVEPNSVQMTTETTLGPRDLQTPDPNNETNVKGVSSHPGTLIAAVVVLLVLVGGVSGYLLKHKKQQELLEYDDAPNKPSPV